MQVALLAPSPVPFAVGGAERLCWALQAWLNEHTKHQVELVKLPSPEGDFWSLIDSYRAFASLDVRHFDCVVSTKYPSWMVEHPNHVCYLLHRLRGLYDAYHFFGVDERVDHAEPRLAALQRVMRAHPEDRGALEDVFARLADLRHASDLPAYAFAFPGPLTREVVHFLDGVGLSRAATKRYAAISRTVAQRRDYFPPGAKVTVAYPPPQIAEFREGPFEYLFSMSRLDPPKRLDLVIEAMKHVQSDVRLKVAGTGPDASRLKSLAGNDPRIEFLGYVSDKEAIEHYSRALAVPFVPYDEDLGLITFEAMLAAKPVLTVEDSGGPREFVEHGVTGYVTRAEPRAFAEAIEAVAKSPGHARAMGGTARERMHEIRWERVAEALFGESTTTTTGIATSTPGRTRIPAPAGRRSSLVAALSFPVYPPRGGGQTRVFHLYRHVARHADVRLVTLAEASEGSFDGEIAPGLRETRVPKSPSHASRESAASARVDWIPVSDIVLADLHGETPAYGAALRESLANAEAVVASHPYAWPAIRAANARVPCWYEAHNVEAALKRAMLPRTTDGDGLVERTREVEQGCADASELVMTVTENDAVAIAREYAVEAKRLIVVPNGVDLDSVQFVDAARRRQLKQALGLGGRHTALFMASWHQPNLEAAEELIAVARELPGHEFLVVGSACGALSGRALPENVKLIGVVDDETKSVLLGAVDVALNPMRSGSGSNLKMLDYMAAGAPVITTRFGARGTEADERLVTFAENDGLRDAVVAAARDPASMLGKARAAREHVESHFCWRIIAERFVREAEARGLLARH